VSMADAGRLQQSDTYCQSVVAQLSTTSSQISAKETRRATNLRKSFSIEDGILYNTSGAKPCVVLPAILKTTALQICHDRAAHGDARRTLQLLRQRYFWRNMRKDTRAYVRSCNECQRVNHRTTLSPGL